MGESVEYSLVTLSVFNTMLLLMISIRLYWEGKALIQYERSRKVKNVNVLSMA